MIKAEDKVDSQKIGEDGLMEWERQEIARREQEEREWAEQEGEEDIVQGKSQKQGQEEEVIELPEEMPRGYLEVSKAEWQAIIKEYEGTNAFANSTKVAGGLAPIIDQDGRQESLECFLKIMGGWTTALKEGIDKHRDVYEQLKNDMHYIEKNTGVSWGMYWRLRLGSIQHEPACKRLLDQWWELKEKAEIRKREKGIDKEDAGYDKVNGFRYKAKGRLATISHDQHPDDITIYYDGVVIGWLNARTGQGKYVDGVSYKLRALAVALLSSSVDKSKVIKESNNDW